MNEELKKLMKKEIRWKERTFPDYYKKKKDDDEEDSSTSSNISPRSLCVDHYFSSLKIRDFIADIAIVSD